MLTIGLLNRNTGAVNAAQSGVHPLVNAILDFQKLKILTSGPVRRLSVRHRTKFREDRSKRCRRRKN